jgi:hypothetical protein
MLEKGDKGSLPVLVCAHVRGVASLGDDAAVGPLGAVGIQLMAAVCLVIVLALPAVETGVGLRSYANALAWLNQGDFRTNSQSFPNNFWKWSVGGVRKLAENNYRGRRREGNVVLPNRR